MVRVVRMTELIAALSALPADVVELLVVEVAEDGRSEPRRVPGPADRPGGGGPRCVLTRSRAARTR